ncbi:hypothetical protein [Streptomyces heilongjiangensis]|uniref:Uncharacterized protein n=1 Tax=Streptomyces heilongjiangensis TaxID=945052 RepID=A0ABW1BJ08_9ACTN|nr:hypothetical protein [Streptomyces heilongjiangensis]MDC2952239.1 hypothetical protein [Streptomyces heilongjiangensis]
MNRRLSGRLARLEHHLGTAPDLARERAEHGGLIWSSASSRAYGQDTPAGARLAVVGPAGATVYEVAGVTLADLS